MNRLVAPCLVLLALGGVAPAQDLPGALRARTRRIEVSGPSRAPTQVEVLSGTPAPTRTVVLAHPADVAVVVSAATAEWVEPAHVPGGERLALRFLAGDGGALASGALVACDGDRGWACFLLLDGPGGAPARTVAVSGRLAWLLVPLLTAEEGRPACPACGAERFAVPVVMGPPPPPDVLRRARRGDFVLGGCTDLTYRWRCKACEHEWPAEVERGR